jgi:hypothetical protein
MYIRTSMMKVCRSLNATRYLEGSVRKHLVETTTAMWRWLHRVCWRIIAEMTMAWASGISTIQNHDAVHDMRRGTENLLIQFTEGLRTARWNLSPEDTHITATSPIFSDSLRERSETSLLASLSGPCPRAEQVLPAYAERTVSPTIFTNTSRTPRRKQRAHE